MSGELARVVADLERHKDLFNLERDGLGKALCKAATDGVQRTIEGQQTPDGARWPELDPAYDAWKSDHFPGKPMAVLHEIMAQPDQVAGDVAVSAGQAIVTYGTDEQARQEATWFQERRLFWGFTESSLTEVKSLLDARFATG
jgi:hypothetical protein